MEPRLPTLVCADVVDFDRLIESDKSGMLEQLRGHRRDLIVPKVAQHGGRSIKLDGGRELLEFPSVVDAVTCAIEVQNGMHARNLAIGSGVRIEFRLGINLGDAIVDGEEYYGDGVEVVACLESLADPGGICVHRDVRDLSLRQLDLDFNSLGDITIRNIARTIQADTVVFNEKTEAIASPVIHQIPSKRLKIWPVLVAVCIGFVLILLFNIWGG